MTKKQPAAVDPIDAAQLPLAPVVLQILVALGQGERHGYSISKEIGGPDPAVRAGSGTLYRHLAKMCADGWIRETARDEGDALRRRYYRLTPRGRKVAEAEIRRLETLVALARSRRFQPVPG